MSTRVLTEARDREWYDRNEAGESQASIANDAKVDQSYVSRRIKSFKEKYKPKDTVQKNSLQLAIAERSVFDQTYKLAMARLDRIDWQKIETMGGCLAELSCFMDTVDRCHIEFESRRNWNPSGLCPFQKAHLLATARMVEIQRESGFAGDGVTWLRDLEGSVSQN